jgi:signal transduction histidine kinase
VERSYSLSRASATGTADFHRGVTAGSADSPAAFCGIVARLLAAGGRESIPSVLVLLSQVLQAEVDLEVAAPIGSSDPAVSARVAIPKPRIRSTVDITIGTRTETVSAELGGRPIDLPVTSRGAVLAVLSIEPSRAGLPAGWVAEPASLGMIADLLALALAAPLDAGERPDAGDRPEGRSTVHEVAQTWFEYEEQDRADLAGHLHDGLVQSLIAARYLLDIAAASQPQASQPDGSQPWLATLRESIQEALADGRSLLHSLQPRTKHGRGLCVALEDYCSSSRFPVTMRPGETGAHVMPQLTPVVAAAAYRFALAAVADLRARGADGAELQLNYAPGSVALDVGAATDRSGAAAHAGLQPQEAGLPLQRWATRIELLGGDIVLHPASAHLRFSAADEELAPTPPLASR